MASYSFTDYSPIVLDHFEHPRNVGPMEDPDAIGRAGNPACGDQVELSLRIRQGRIEEARFLASGCSASIASSSMTTVLLTGMTLQEAAALTDVTVAEALGGLPPAKIHCSVLASDVVASALEDYARRKGGALA
jgi:nitrogen fixation NifU-like protein